MQLKALEIFATSTLSSLKSNELSSSPVVYVNINLMGYGIKGNSLAVALVIDCTFNFFFMFTISYHITVNEIYLFRGGLGPKN
jgi:hypothetical protein